MSEENVEHSINSYLPLWETDVRLNDLNVVSMLHEFWEQKQFSANKRSSTESEDLSGETVCRTEGLLLYESAPGSSCVCYVTLPGGSCFGNYKVCNTQAEARRDAARVALMNSMVNELPCRQITSHFINQNLQQATSDSTMSIEDARNSATSLGTYSLLLHSYIGKTMLQFQLLHWNGTLKALKKRKYSRQSVISYYSQRGLDEQIRSSMALDWLSREQRSPGRIGDESYLAQRELGLARQRGQELRFYKEKTEILCLALSQAYVHSTLKADEAPSNKYNQEYRNLPLYRLCSQDSQSNTTPPCGSPSAHHKNTTTGI
ncbi:protein limb expression 1-like isoform X2 [Eucyclogobius newberryi]|uniref:protein limb expression 1-like isoform X2 n=1 Tax=Eucyclogobius newberryi TaxID=166745 RepID=UPI003B5AB57E